MTAATETDEDGIERACRRLVLESAAANDRGDYAAYGELFTAGGILRRPSGDVLEGRAAIVGAYASRAGGRTTRHVCSNILIHVESARAAHGTTYVVLYSADTSGEPDGHFGHACAPRVLIGEFEDRFELTEAGWRIAERNARFVMHT
jgi:hypothetical protein